MPTVARINRLPSGVPPGLRISLERVPWSYTFDASRYFFHTLPYYCHTATLLPHCHTATHCQAATLPCCHTAMLRDRV